MRTGQSGFTLIELMIVVAVIGILTSLAIPAYQSYSVRAQVSEGLVLTGPLKTAVASFYNNNGAFPADNTAAGVDAASEYSSKYVGSISISGSVIEIQYGNDASAQIGGQTVTLTGTGSEGSVSWTCSSGGFIQDYYLPSACR